MAQCITVHVNNPQPRLIKQAVDSFLKGQVIVFPTDSGYALGAHWGDKAACEQICKIRQLDKHHAFSLVCHDLSQLGRVAKVDNSTFRLLKAHLPGPFTFILSPTRAVPKRLCDFKRKTIGVRIPQCAVARELVSALGEPIMTVSLNGSSFDDLEDQPIWVCPDAIQSQFGHQVGLILSAGVCPVSPTTVVDCTQQPFEILRQGHGNLDQ